MRHRIAFFLLALLGVFGAGRTGEAQSGIPSGEPATRASLPPIDQIAAARTATATFALG
jgi:hypothetical protein